jgi:hypothetical protein
MFVCMFVRTALYANFNLSAVSAWILTGPAVYLGSNTVWSFNIFIKLPPALQRVIDGHAGYTDQTLHNRCTFSCVD